MPRKPDLKADAQEPGQKTKVNTMKNWNSNKQENGNKRKNKNDRNE